MAIPDPDPIPAPTPHLPPTLKVHVIVPFIPFDMEPLTPAEQIRGAMLQFQWHAQDTNPLKRIRDAWWAFRYRLALWINPAPGFHDVTMDVDD